MPILTIYSVHQYCIPGRQHRICKWPQGGLFWCAWGHCCTQWRVESPSAIIACKSQNPCKQQTKSVSDITANFNATPWAAVTFCLSVAQRRLSTGPTSETSARYTTDVGPTPAASQTDQWHRTSLWRYWGPHTTIWKFNRPCSCRCPWLPLLLLSLSLWQTTPYSVVVHIVRTGDLPPGF